MLEQTRKIMTARMIRFACLAILLLSNCTFQKKTASPATIPSLAHVFASDFKIGVALNADQIQVKDAGAGKLIKQQFNMATPANVMKAQTIHPRWDEYNFEAADQLIAYGEKNNFNINGHTLIWHSQLPSFVLQIQSADSFRLFFTQHINKVAGHFKNRIHSWDVVNEALNEDGSLRNSIFLKQLGADFVTDAFRLAQAASPGAELYYNDFNNEQPAKRAGCITLIKKIQAGGARIDGVGIQGHWHVGRVPFKDIEESIIQYHQLGVQVMITELDIDVLPGNFRGAEVSQRVQSSPQLNPYTGGLPDSIQQQLASDYANLFKLFLKHRDKISRVTFWGLHDGVSWLNNWPVAGRTNHPLLFDRMLQPKPAFYRVIATKQAGDRKRASD